MKIARLLYLLMFCQMVFGASRPNIILIETDDQRADSIAALGDKTIYTPNLDRLVKEGFSFTNARNQGSYTGAVCIASRSMCMSGQSLWRYDDHLKGRVTLGELLGNSGYETYGTGKWHNGPEAMKRSFGRADNLTPGFLPQGHDSAFLVQSIRDGKIINGKNVPPRYSTSLIGQTAVDFLQSNEGKKPFFLYVGFNAPHDPYTRLPEQEKRYRDAQGKSTVPNYSNFMPTPPVDPGVMKIRDEVLLKQPRNPDEVANQNAIYFAMITDIDAWVGKILDALKAKGLEKDTIVVFTSDHGLARGSHGLLGKQNLYEHTLRVPMILRGPGIVSDKRDASPVYLFEVYRTLTDLAGVKTPPKQGEGISWRSLLEGKTPAGPRVFYHGYISQMRAVTDERWKLIEYRVKGVRSTQLFDLKNDPNEMKDLSKEAGQEKRIESLREQMLRQREAFGDNDANFWTKIGFGPDLKGLEKPKSPESVEH